MAEESERPSWLDEPCPPWCVGGHRPEDHPEDRAHRSEGLVVPGVVAAFTPGVEAPRPCELVVILSRRIGQSQTWLFIGETEGTEQRLRVTVETAGPLATAIGAASRGAEQTPT